MKKIFLTAFTLALFTAGVSAQIQTKENQPVKMNSGRNDAVGLRHDSTAVPSNAQKTQRKEIATELQPVNNTLPQNQAPELKTNVAKGKRPQTPPEN